MAMALNQARQSSRFTSRYTRKLQHYVRSADYRRQQQQRQAATANSGQRAKKREFHTTKLVLVAQSRQRREAFVRPLPLFVSAGSAKLCALCLHHGITAKRVQSAASVCHSALCWLRSSLLSTPVTAASHLYVRQITLGLCLSALCWPCTKLCAIPARIAAASQLARVDTLHVLEDGNFSSLTAAHSGLKKPWAALRSTRR